jgi:hypothetical protein
VLQDPAGDGDGTVPTSSGVGVDAPNRPAPGDIKLRMEHQPAYENKLMQEWAIKAITAMVKHRYWEQRKPAGGAP